jgi:glycosyltransferase involved in cell wall biosynthesis
MKKVKIVHVSNVPYTVRYILRNQLIALNEMGYDVTVICHPDGDFSEFERSGVRVRHVPMTRKIAPLMDLQTLLGLVRTLRQLKPDLVHAHNPKSGFLGRVAARIAGVPKIVNTVHGFYFHDRSNGLGRWAWVMMERIAGKCSDSILCQSAEDVRTAESEKISSQDKVAWLGCGIDLDRYDPVSVPSSSMLALRKEWGLSGYGQVIGFVGRLNREKGLADLLRAFPQVLTACPEALLVVIGSGKEGERDALDVEDLADKLKVSSQVRFLGLREDMALLYSAMDLVVLPSYREGYPRVLMEAAAMGKPSVGTNIRGCREVIEDGVTGLLVEPGDVDGLAQAMVKLLKDRALAERMGKAARARAESLFDERRGFESIARTYEELLSSSGNL